MVPDFTTIWWWRVVKMKINLDPKINLQRGDIVIAVDSTGINVQNEENGYLINGRRKCYGCKYKYKENSFHGSNKRNSSLFSEISTFNFYP